MNYDHSYHAGNFADVVKHAVLARIVEYLKRKEKPFRVIDTHAGSGLYDLSSERAQKTGEWLAGIGRLLAADLPADAALLLKPYLEAVEAYNPGPGVRFYPGSPVLVRHLLRARDRLTAIELHPEAAFALKTRFAGDFQSRVIELDGWLALGAHVPPKEKRGLVLVDPPYEIDDEFARIADGLARAHARWPGGIYAFWYPLKDRAAVAAFRDELRRAAIPRILDVTLSIRGPIHFPRLDGSGLILVNPPFALEDELRILLPALRDALAEDNGASWSLEWLAGESVPG
ncbi:MAG: 23S rRNA (adenine(2030)-N(6))-methyltransferase RlmJ [Mesorhizobium sp.]|nr:23S rRNA (adenine(2030)-N(6))-methyltransferase RlmJ [Mesorhizobium sp.]